MFFVIDTSASQAPKYEDRIWRHLWEMRDVVPVSVVLPTVVSSPCPLLAEESADSILSSTGIQVPQNSAWIPMQLDVSHFARDNGDIRLKELETALRACVDRGDSLHDSNDWPSPAISFDSWLNRRLAVAIGGWGSLVKLRGADPRAFQTLRELEALADFIGKTLFARSQMLARERGYCPAVDVAGKRILASGSEMRLRWQRAVEHSASRHRNLITMSAWDVFPKGQPADVRYVDLLPLLRCANSLSFQRDVDIAHWSISEFRNFYERVSAILRCILDAGRIAKQV
jgi:hypothetical protein